MIRRLLAFAFPLLAAAAPARAQLGLITVPQHSLRIDIVGAFYPNDQSWVDGHKVPLGSFIDGAANPIVRSLQQQFTAALGSSVSGLSLGGVSAIASRDQGVGDLGFAYGLSKRLTVFGNLPIVYVRSRISPTFDATTSRVGANPANIDPTVGNTAGRTQTVLFLSSFRDALDTLNARVRGGSYAGDATKLALAQQTLTTGNTTYNALNNLLLDPAHASAVLPVASDPYTVQLLARITDLQGTFQNGLGVSGFTSLPAFPTTTLTDAQFSALLNSPFAFGLASPNNHADSAYGIGDMSAGVAYQLLSNGSVGSESWRTVWLRATARFPNGRVPNPGELLDQGTGAKRKAVELEAIAEWGKRGLGVRAEVAYLHQLPANRLTRPTSPEELLVPPTFLAAVTTSPGDSIAITARPFYAFAQHLALTAMVQYWRRGVNSTKYVEGQVPIAGADPASLDVGSAANAVVVGFGLSYFHDGRSRDGDVSLPIEASWSIERTVASGAGIFPVAMTSRVALRIYRPLGKN